MEANRNRFTGHAGGGGVPARRRSELDLRHSGYLPDSVREEEDRLLQLGYIIGRTLDCEGQLAHKINDGKRRLYFDAVETYAGLVDDTVDLKDSIDNEEKQELILGFAQVVLNEAGTGFMRSLKTAEAKMNRVGETDLSLGLKARQPKEKTVQRRKLTLGERFRGEAVIVDE